MKKYICPACQYVYDPELGDPDSGIAPGTPFEDLPDDWVCPECGLAKADFEELQNSCVLFIFVTEQIRQSSERLPFASKATRNGFFLNPFHI